MSLITRPSVTLASTLALFFVTYMLATRITLLYDYYVSRYANQKNKTALRYLGRKNVALQLKRRGVYYTQWKLDGNRARNWKDEWGNEMQIQR